MRIPLISDRKATEALRSRSALAMFSEEYASHSSGVKELKSQRTKDNDTVRNKSI